MNDRLQRVASESDDQKKGKGAETENEPVTATGNAIAIGIENAGTTDITTITTTAGRHGLANAPTMTTMTAIIDINDRATTTMATPTIMGVTSADIDTTTIAIAANGRRRRSTLS